MTLALYGGSFNPPHRGHTAVARHALGALRPDVFLWMPAGDPPHKSLPDGTPPPEKRLELSRLAVSGLSGVTVSDYELRGGARYTADTARALRKMYNPGALWLIMGLDMFLTLESWREPDALLALCSVAVYRRGGGREDDAAAHAEHLRRRFGAEIALMEHDALEISSTELRGLLSAGGGAEYLTPEVFELIAKEGLYGFPSNSAKP